MLLERFFSSGNRPPLMMFDFDGVICNSLEAVLPEIEMVFSEVGFTGIKTREELISLLDGNVFLRLTAAGFPMGKLKWLGNRFKSHQEEVYQRIDPFPGIVEVVNRLAESVPVYIITGNRAATVAQFCARHGIRGVRQIIGSDVERSKVKSIRRIRKLHRDRSPFYIGDTLGDMREARKARVKRIGAAWGWHGRERLSIAKPEHIVESPEELREVFDLLLRQGG
jgi:phosphoglycolate phosphatase